MKKLTVRVGKTYDILIEKGLLDSVASIIRAKSIAKKIVLVTDTNVAPLYSDKVQKSLEGEGFQVFVFTFLAGESSKNLGTIGEMLEFMANNGLNRSDLVVALGGGVCGDMAGFGASIYLRGIDFVQIPTTLLAQIDSSIGGKTGVDLPQGKNLCGAFHQPICVIIDPLTLDTLSEKFFNDGMAEAIKTGCIKSVELFNMIANENITDFIEDLIYECVQIKSGVVERDEKEHGERALLNFGHTIGHAIEKHYNFSGYSHGEAVAIGMVMISKAAEQLDLTKKGTADKIITVLKKYNLPFEDSASIESLFKAMEKDKKRTGDGINFVILADIGYGIVHHANKKEIDVFKGALKDV